MASKNAFVKDLVYTLLKIKTKTIQRRKNMFFPIPALGQSKYATVSVDVNGVTVTGKCISYYAGMNLSHEDYKNLMEENKQLMEEFNNRVEAVRLQTQEP
jgi:hypothetical protein